MFFISTIHNSFFHDIVTKSQNRFFLKATSFFRTSLSVTFSFMTSQRSFALHLQGKAMGRRVDELLLETNARALMDKNHQRIFTLIQFKHCSALKNEKKLKTGAVGAHLNSSCGCWDKYSARTCVANTLETANP